MRKQTRRIGLCTGGGDCPGLNAAIRAVVRHAAGTYGIEVVGIREGLTGLTSEPPDVMPLSIEKVAMIHETGGTILGTNNKGSPFRDKQEGAKVLAAIKKGWRALKLDAAIVIGGDGSHFMARHLVEVGLNVVGIPKTIDNDLHGTEQTIGFSTCVDIAAEAASRLKTSAEAHNRIMILEVMGRDAGHIALATGLASGADAVLLPEIPFSAKELVRRFQMRRRLGRDSWLVVAAEGAFEAGKQPTFQEAASGAKLLGGIGAEVARLLHQETEVDARVAVLGHVQRGGPANAADRILAALMGTRAVDMVQAEHFGKIVAVRKGALAEIAYKTVVDGRRLVDLKGDDVAAAEAAGICLGRPSPYKAAN